MANPRLENGYTPIANEIFDALVRTRIPGEARQVLDFIIRKTYGYGKTEDAISLSQFHEATGMFQPNIIRALGKLISMNIIRKDNRKLSEKIIGIIRKDNSTIATYCFIKDFSTWKPLPKQTPRGKARLSEKIHTDNIYSSSSSIRKKKGIIRKDNPSLEDWFRELKDNLAYQGIDIPRLWGKMVAWCEVNGKKPTQRRFVNWLNREEKPVKKEIGVKGAVDYSAYR